MREEHGTRTLPTEQQRMNDSHCHDPASFRFAAEKYLHKTWPLAEQRVTGSDWLYAILLAHQLCPDDCVRESLLAMDWVAATYCFSEETDFAIERLERVHLIEACRTLRKTLSTYPADVLLHRFALLAMFSIEPEIQAGIQALYPEEKREHIGQVARIARNLLEGILKSNFNKTNAREMMENFVAAFATLYITESYAIDHIPIPTMRSPHGRSITAVKTEIGAPRMPLWHCPVHAGRQ